MSTDSMSTSAYRISRYTIARQYFVLLSPRQGRTLNCGMRGLTVAIRTRREPLTPAASRSFSIHTSVGSDIHLQYHCQTRYYFCSGRGGGFIRRWRVHSDCDGGARCGTGSSLSVERGEGFDHVRRALERGAEVVCCWNREGAARRPVQMSQPLRTESSHCIAHRRVVGGEPLCLAKVFVSMLRVS